MFSYESIQQSEFQSLKILSVIQYLFVGAMKSAPKLEESRLRPKRQRKPVSKYMDYNMGASEYYSDLESDDEDLRKKSKGKGKKKAFDKLYEVNDKGEFLHPEEIFDENLVIDKLPKKIEELERLNTKIGNRIEHYKKAFLEECEANKTALSYVHSDSIPIMTDVRTFDFELLRQKQLEFGQKLFDVIMIDPPWKLATSNPSRGVAIQYSSLPDDIIGSLPIPSLSQNGYLFLWTINAKYSYSCKLMKSWGYNLVDQLGWVKKTVNGRIAKGHGYYLQHAKQSCLIGYKGDISKFKTNFGSDIIFSERRGQSQKPEEIYEIIQEMYPNGFYLQIFGRRNNLRGKWVTIGNEL